MDDVKAAGAAAAPILYEVEAMLDPAVVAEFDAWLPGHVADVLACPGFLGARMLQHQSSEGVAPVRRVVYRLESRAALEDYLRNSASRLRADAALRFGDRVQFARRVLAPLGAAPIEPPPATTCLNCGASVRGPFCASCGQRRDVRLKSVGEVFHDFTHTLTHVDSRAWQTLRLLVLRPGALTVEFFRGRLASYLPPFRLYLVLSLAFFAVSALLPGDQEDDAARQAARTAATQELQRGLSRAAADPKAPEAVRRVAGSAASRAGGTSSGACQLDVDLPALGGLGPKLNEACRRIAADDGRHFADVMRATAPRLMFVFMPLIAAFALLLYWRPRRLYAEHLVFYLHGHALLFLALTAVELLGALVGLVPPVGLLIFAVFVWLPWYYYRAMRVVYGQGHKLTLAKFATLGIAYFALLGVTLLAGVVYAALSV